MVTITCPWCAEDGTLEWADLAALETTFTCSECGTAVRLVDEVTPALEVAA